MKKVIYCLAGSVLLLPVLMAHHSFAAEYDASKPISLSNATVTKVEWMNPHIWVYMDVKDAAGKVAKWECEGGPPNTLTRGGWTKSVVQAGAVIALEGTRAKDGTNTCNLRSITMADGRKLGAGSSEGKQ
jgi:Family of unknown function (DUF6152)